MILNDKTEYEVTEEAVKEYQELYPAVDVKQQFRSMKGWCDSNPTNRKTRSGIKRFINSWLSREQNRGGNYKPEIPQEKTTGKNFDANKGLIKGSYDFEELERMAAAEPIIQDIPQEKTKAKPESKLQSKLLSLPVDSDFRFAYQGKEFWGTRYETVVAIKVKGGDFEQIPIDKIDEHVSDMPDYKAD